MAKNEQTVAEYTLADKQIEALKKKHGSIHVISVAQGDKTLKCVLKDPLEKDLNIVMAAMAIKDNVVKRNLFLLDNLWIEGDEAFKNNNLVRLSGSVQASNLIEVLEGTVEKF